MRHYRIAIAAAATITASSAFAPGRQIGITKRIISNTALHANLNDDEPCVVGENVVQSCEVVLPTDQSKSSTQGGTQTKLSAATNLGKCICGAGSFALPHVFLDEGVLGGTLAMSMCGLLAAITMQSINRSRYTVSRIENVEPPTSYVALTEMALGATTSKLVFALTLAASLGVCSTYIVFVGQTLASLSADELSNNIVHSIAPNVDERTWEIITAATVYPLSLIRNYGVFAFTSALGVTAVLGGIATTLVYGVFVDPGLGIFEALAAVTELKMWPDSIADAFGGSFGTIAYLFCVNFLTFPIINSMKDAEEEYSSAVSSAVAVIWVVNVVFALICLSFYGDSTQDLVLQNLDNGPYLSALKLLLCIDLLFTFPVVFSSGRQILENYILGETSDDSFGTNGAEQEEENELTLALSRAAITGSAVGTCFGLSQLGGFGTVANLVGGLAQGTLAFIIPPAIEIALSRKSGESSVAKEIPQWAENQQDIEESESAATTTSNIPNVTLKPDECKNLKWHPNFDTASKKCSNSMDIPLAQIQDETFQKMFFFDTLVECCQMFFHVDECEMEDVCVDDYLEGVGEMLEEGEIAFERQADGELEEVEEEGESGYDIDETHAEVAEEEQGLVNEEEGGEEEEVNFESAEEQVIQLDETNEKTNWEGFDEDMTPQNVEYEEPEQPSPPIEAQDISEAQDDYEGDGFGAAMKYKLLRGKGHGEMTSSASSANPLTAFGSGALVAAILLLVSCCLCYLRYRRRRYEQSKRPNRGNYAALGRHDFFNGTFSDDVSYGKSSDDDMSVDSYGSDDGGQTNLEMGGIHEFEANGGLTLEEING